MVFGYAEVAGAAAIVLGCTATRGGCAVPLLVGALALEFKGGIDIVNSKIAIENELTGSNNPTALAYTGGALFGNNGQNIGNNLDMIFSFYGLTRSAASFAGSQGVINTLDFGVGAAQELTDP